VQIRQRFMMEYTHELHKVEIREEIAHWITLEMGKTSGDAMGDVWRGLEVVEAAGRVGSEMLVRNVMSYERWKIIGLENRVMIVLVLLDLWSVIHLFVFQMELTRNTYY
jgi:acyl-CoA reductase-like NAD-dependent aldehyde dehydrogenase